MTTKSKVPQIRFKGFSGEWDIKKFGECVLIQRGGSPRPIENFITNNENGINWIKIGDVSTGSRYITQTKEKIIPEGEKHSRKVLIGDLILSNSMSFGRPYIMAIEGCIHDGWLLIRDEKKIFNLEYLLQLLSSEHMINQYKALASGGVVINLNSELVQSTNVFIPNKKEQTKIGDYFQRLDKLIEQKEKKYQKLKQFKKAMLSKMFPKNGADTPEIRFKGFSGKWEEKSLSEIGEIVTGSTPSTQEPLNYSIDGIPWVTPTDISENITLFTSRHLSLKGQSIARIVPKDTILVTCIASIGKNTLLGTIGSFNQQINGLIPNKEKYNSYFLFTESTIWSNNMKKIAASGTMQIINKKEFSELKTYIPKKEEQEKIGNYFQKLDKQINLQQKELEKLKNMKKASLAKMFV